MVDFGHTENESLLDKGIALYNHKAFDQALAVFQKLVALQPNHAVAHYNIGNVYSDLGNLDEAIASYHKAIQVGGLDEDASLAWYNLGNIYYRKADVPKAVDAYRTAISINRGLAMAYNNLGLVLAAQPDKASRREAITVLENARKLKSDDIDVLNNLGIAYGGLGNMDKALALFNKARELKPRDSKAYINSAKAITEKGGDINKAITLLKKAGKIAPDDFNVHYNLGGNLSRKAERERSPDGHRELLNQAIASYHKALRIKPDDFNCLYNLAGDYLKKAERASRKQRDKLRPDVHRELLDKAIAFYRKAIKSNPAHPAGYFNLAHAFEEKGDYENAINNYRKAIEIKPDHADAYYNLSNTYRQQGKLTEAIKPLETALLIYQKQKNHFKAAHCYFHLGGIYAGMTQRKKSIQMHLRSLKIAGKLKNRGLEAANYAMLVGLYGQQDKLKQVRQAARKLLKIVK